VDDEFIGELLEQLPRYYCSWACCKSHKVFLLTPN
jgi:hypothetical protein